MSERQKIDLPPFMAKVPRYVENYNAYKERVRKAEFAASDRPKLVPMTLQEWYKQVVKPSLVSHVKSSLQPSTSNISGEVTASTTLSDQTVLELEATRSLLVGGIPANIINEPSIFSSDEKPKIVRLLAISIRRPRI